MGSGTHFENDALLFAYRCPASDDRIATQGSPARRRPTRGAIGFAQR
jgi:hypothetical protein